MTQDPRITTVVAKDLARPGGHYSHAKRFGELAFTSGQLPAGAELWPRFNSEMMGESRPARTVVPVPELHYGYLVEIDAVAVCGK